MHDLGFWDVPKVPLLHRLRLLTDCNYLHQVEIISVHAEMVYDQNKREHSEGWVITSHFPPSPPGPSCPLSSP